MNYIQLTLKKLISQILLQKLFQVNKVISQHFQQRHIIAEIFTGHPARARLFDLIILSHSQDVAILNISKLFLIRLCHYSLNDIQ